MNSGPLVFLINNGHAFCQSLDHHVFFLDLSLSPENSSQKLWDYCNEVKNTCIFSSLVSIKDWQTLSVKGQIVNLLTLWAIEPLLKLLNSTTGL